jgi:hypothetical protein
MYDLAGAAQVAFVAYFVVGTFIDAAYFDMFYYLIAIVVIMKERLAVPIGSELAHERHAASRISNVSRSKGRYALEA